MKTIEQKAKAYDEAIERYKAKQEYESQKVHEFIEYLFPELKESEDERIRKDIIVLVKDWWDRVNKDNISTKEQMLTWLEKQCEQKPAETEKGAKGNEREIPISVWSEEDEKKIESIIGTIRIRKFEYPQLAPVYEEDIDWLKSLKDRYTWKPSEVQMVVLNDIIINGHLSNANERVLKGLQEQLKKLREE